MLQVVFKKLQAQNFLSIGDEPIKIEFKTGLNVITGKNYDKIDRSNGVGKSTIADALHFGLFGSTIRELSKENIVNNITNGKCLVILEFDTIQGKQIDSYRIERSLNPSKCGITKNTIDVTRSGIPQTNEYITEIIRSTSSLFQNGVIMRVNNTVPFMAQKKADKRKFIEGILNLESFSDMLLLARSDYNDTKKNFDVESAKIVEVEKTINILKAQQVAFETDKQKKLQDITLKLNEHQAEIESTNAKIVESIPNEETTINAGIIELKGKLEKISDTVELSNKRKGEYNFQILSAKGTIKEIDTKKGTCKFCAKDIDDLLSAQNEQKRQEMLLEIKKNEDLIAKELELVTAQKALKERVINGITVLEQRLMAYKLKVKENENLQNRIDQIKKWVKFLKDSEQDVINSKGNFDADLTSAQTRHNEFKDKITGYKERLEIIDAAKYVVSEEGVKSILVKKILKLLNNKLAYYLKKMEANCIITFNEYFEELITNEKGVTCVYDNFSGAECKAIDLACLFTFMDIRRLQGDLSINISMYDELLDTAVDEKGIDLILDILKERIDKYNEAVYIISHRRESIKHVTGEVIFIEKRGGISERAVYQSN